MTPDPGMGWVTLEFVSARWQKQLARLTKTNLVQSSKNLDFCPILECCPLGPLELLPHWGVFWVSQTPAKNQLTHTFCFFFSNVLGWRDIRPAQVFWLALNSLCQKAPTLFRMERDALLTVLKTSVAGHWLRSELKSRCKISLTWQDLATAREIRSMWLPAGAAAAGSHWCESLHLTGQ